MPVCIVDCVVGCAQDPTREKTLLQYARLLLAARGADQSCAHAAEICSGPMHVQAGVRVYEYIK